MIRIELAIIKLKLGTLEFTELFINCLRLLIEFVIDTIGFILLFIGIKSLHHWIIDLSFEFDFPFLGSIISFIASSIGITRS